MNLITFFSISCIHVLVQFLLAIKASLPPKWSDDDEVLREADIFEMQDFMGRLSLLDDTIPPPVYRLAKEHFEQNRVDQALACLSGCLQGGDKPLKQHELPLVFNEAMLEKIFDLLSEGRSRQNRLAVSSLIVKIVDTRILQKDFLLAALYFLSTCPNMGQKEVFEAIAFQYWGSVPVPVIHNFLTTTLPKLLSSNAISGYAMTLKSHTCAMFTCIPADDWTERIAQAMLQQITAHPFPAGIAMVLQVFAEHEAFRHVMYPLIDDLSMNFGRLFTGDDEEFILLLGQLAKEPSRMQREYTQFKEFYLTKVPPVRREQKVAVSNDFLANCERMINVASVVPSYTGPLLIDHLFTMLQEMVIVLDDRLIDILSHCNCFESQKIIQLLSKMCERAKECLANPESVNVFRTLYIKLHPTKQYVVLNSLVDIYQSDMDPIYLPMLAFCWKMAMTDCRRLEALFIHFVSMTVDRLGECVDSVQGQEAQRYRFQYYAQALVNAIHLVSERTFEWLCKRLIHGDIQMCLEYPFYRFFILKEILKVRRLFSLSARRRICTQVNKLYRTCEGARQILNFIYKQVCE